MDSPANQVNLVTVTRRERNRLAVTKYRQTEAGKAAMARYVNKRRELKLAQRQKDSLTNPTDE